MSHFTVAVFHKDGEKTVDELLAPYQENNMCDCPREYLEFNDVEEEYKEEYESKYKNKYNTFEEFMEEHYGYDSRDEKMNRYGYWENPNAHWDWYEIGGRWSGLLKLKISATSGSYGSRSWTNQNQIIPENRVDSAKIKDIDFSVDKKQYYKLIRFWELKVEGDAPKNEQEKKLLEYDFYKKEYYTDKYKNKEEYAAIESSFSTYAVITPDGEWHSKGEMGWFGCGTETDAEAKKWTKSFKEAFIDNADPELNLTIVDCHI